MQLLSNPHLQQLANSRTEILRLLWPRVVISCVRQYHQRPLQIFAAGFGDNAPTESASEVRPRNAPILAVNIVCAHSANMY